MKRLFTALTIVALATAIPASAGLRSWLERKSSADTVGSVSIKATVSQESVTVFERIMMINNDGSPMTNEDGKVLYREDRSKAMWEFSAIAQEKSDGDIVAGTELRIRCDPQNMKKKKQLEYCSRLKLGATINLGGVLGIDQDTILFATRVKED